MHGGLARVHLRLQSATGTADCMNYLSRETCGLFWKLDAAAAAALVSMPLQPSLAHHMRSAELVDQSDCDTQ